MVVDGSDVCRAPIVAFTLRKQLASSTRLRDEEVVSRGLAALEGSTMCESASAKLGWSGPAIAHFGAHRSTPLTVDDIADAALVLTAERAQRSAVVRLLPGTQARVFTWKEALVLASVLADRVRNGIANAPEDLPALTRALHAARGTVPLIEPAVRTGPLHFRRGQEADPLSIADGHAGQALHKHVTQESFDVASQLGARLVEVTAERLPEIRPAERHERARWWRQRA